jgi:hypothetical protein
MQKRIEMINYGQHGREQASIINNNFKALTEVCQMLEQRIIEQDKKIKELEREKV